MNTNYMNLAAKSWVHTACKEYSRTAKKTKEKPQQNSPAKPNGQMHSQSAIWSIHVELLAQYPKAHSSQLTSQLKPPKPEEKEETKQQKKNNLRKGGKGQ